VQAMPLQLQRSSTRTWQQSTRRNTKREPLGYIRQWLALNTKKDQLCMSKPAVLPSIRQQLNSRCCTHVNEHAVTDRTWDTYNHNYRSSPGTQSR
jgi:hypothetical protein